eukprot:Pgem_evm1s6624
MGPGSKCGHWDEQILGNEVMTPIIDDNQVISNITIASLEDLGYIVDYSQAELITPETTGVDDEDLCMDTPDIIRFMACLGDVAKDDDDQCTVSTRKKKCFETSFTSPVCTGLLDDEFIAKMEKDIKLY